MLFRGVVTQTFLRNKRCRTVLTRTVEKDFDIKVKEVKDLPVAMKVVSYDGKEEIYRYDGNNLYTLSRIPSSHEYPYRNPDFSEESIILSDDSKDVKKELRKTAKRFVVYNGGVWEKTPEPTYDLCWLGGDPVIDVTECGQYNALEYEECRKEAEKRGDPTVLRTICVFRTDAVKRHPRKEELEEKKKKIRLIRKTVKEFNENTPNWVLNETMRCLSNYIKYIANE